MVAARLVTTAMVAPPRNCGGTSYDRAGGVFGVAVTGVLRAQPAGFQEEVPARSAAYRNRRGVVVSEHKPIYARTCVECGCFKHEYPNAGVCNANIPMWVPVIDRARWMLPDRSAVSCLLFKPKFVPVVRSRSSDDDDDWPESSEPTMCCLHWKPSGPIYTRLSGEECDGPWPGARFWGGQDD